MCCVSAGFIALRLRALCLQPNSGLTWKSKRRQRLKIAVTFVGYNRRKWWGPGVVASGARERVREERGGKVGVLVIAENSGIVAPNTALWPSANVWRQLVSPLNAPFFLAMGLCPILNPSSVDCGGVRFNCIFVLLCGKIACHLSRGVATPICICLSYINEWLPSAECWLVLQMLLHGLIVWISLAPAEKSFGGMQSD